jgi:GNAT superfamily N-acetyltransferase
MRRASPESMTSMCLRRLSPSRNSLLPTTRWHVARFAVESTIYLAPEYFRRGLGSELYRALIAEMRLRGRHLAWPVFLAIAIVALWAAA